MKDKFGYGKNEMYPVGTISIRTRIKRGGLQREYIKIASPNKWILRARYIWEEAYGLIPHSLGIHHKDGNPLNDDINNLELVSKSAHLAIHIPEFRQKAIDNFIKARHILKWTTKSLTKITGRHPTNCSCPLHCSA